MDDFDFSADVAYRIEPVYEMDDCDETLLLFAGEMTVVQAHAQCHGVGRIEWTWYPTPSMHFHVENALGHDPLRRGPARLEFANEFAAMDAKVSTPRRLDHSHEFTGEISGLVESSTQGAGDSLSALLFHVPNFHDFVGEPIQSPSSSEIRTGRAVVEFDGWRLTLDRVAGVRQLHAVQSVGGHVWTHTGRLEHATGRVCTAAETREIVHAIRWFLAFCRGAWTAPTLPTGIDGAGQVVWRDLRNVEIDPWSNAPTWPDWSATAWLTNVLPGFWERWKDPTWRDALMAILRWYIDANRSNDPPTSFLLATHALERFAWTCFVRETPLIAESTFRSMTRADRLRLVAGFVGRPVEVPARLEALHARAKAHGRMGVADTLDAMRDVVVHETPVRRRGDEADTVADAASLAVQLVELALLRLFRFDGVYVDRLAPRTGEPALRHVPWAG